MKRVICIWIEEVEDREGVVATNNMVLMQLNSSHGIVTLELAEDGTLQWILYDSNRRIPLKCNPTTGICDLQCEPLINT